MDALIKKWQAATAAWSKDDGKDVILTTKRGEEMMFAAIDLIEALKPGASAPATAAEPDWPRLVPVSVAQHAANNMRIAFHKTRLTREVMVSPDDLSVVLDFVSQAAAPAVQPAAGRPVAWARRWFVDGIVPKKERNENGRMAWPKKFTYHEVTRSKVMADDVALYAHPPAQGSESGGEDWLALVMCNVDRTEGSGLQPVRSLDELNANTATYWRNEARSAIQGRSHLSALSPQPGPASASDLLREAAALFRKYEAHHRAKNTADSLAKAEVNADIAGRIEAAL